MMLIRQIMLIRSKEGSKHGEAISAARGSSLN